MRRPARPQQPFALLATLLVSGASPRSGHADPRPPERVFEVNAARDPAAVYSTAAVGIDPVDQRHIVAAANTIGTAAPVVSFVSRDRGATYTRFNLPNLLSGAAQDSAYAPSVGLDRSGNTYCAYLLGRTAFDLHRVVVAVMPAGKTAWEGPFPTGPDLRDEDKPYLAVDAAPSSPYTGRVYVAWNRNQADGSQNVFLARSGDGRSWQAPVRIDDAGSSGYAIYAAPATGPNGEVYIVWNDYAAANAGFVRMDRSLDGGATFGADRIIADLRLNLQPNPNDPYSIYRIPAQPERGISANPSIGVDISSGPRRGWVYVCYADRPPGATHDDTDIFICRSTDRGATWSPPVRVNDDATTTSQFMPWMSVDPVDGSLNILFYDARDDAANARAHVYYARSLDGGATFEPNVRITSAPSNQSTGKGDPSGNDFGDYLGIAAYGGQVAGAWTDNRDAQLNQVWTATLIHGPTAPVSLQQTVCGLSAPAGTAMWSQELTLTAHLPGPAASLAPEWEVKPAGAPFDGLGLVRGATVAYEGAASVATVSLSGFSNGPYHWRVRAVRTDGLGSPGDWTPFGSGLASSDFTVGVRYTLADASRALRIAAGFTPWSVGDGLRLGPASTLGVTPCETRITVADAVAIARSAR